MHSIGEADLVQKKAFTKWINSHLEKVSGCHVNSLVIVRCVQVGVEVMDLFEDLRDGSILLTLLELLTGKKMVQYMYTTCTHVYICVLQAREKGKMRVHHIQNVKTAINYLTDVRKVCIYRPHPLMTLPPHQIRIVGIPNEEIVDGNRKLTLGLVWMLILNFGVSY